MIYIFVTANYCQCDYP